MVPQAENIFNRSRKRVSKGYDEPGRMGLLLDQDWLPEGPLRDLGKATRLDEIDATLLSFSKREGKATKGTRIISLGNHDSWSTSLPEER